MLKQTTLAAFIAMTGIAFAGQQMADSKYVAPVEPSTSANGQGFYFGLQGGINAWQNYEGTERFSIGGSSVAVERKEKVGGFGGIKLGYAFGQGAIRQAVELDAFYNGVDSDIELRINRKRVADLSERYDTGAFLLNYLIKFDLGSLQPYIGAGAGTWVGQASDLRLTVPGVGSIRQSNNDTEVGFAWQAVAGSELFFTESVSFFLEYKWLNYQNTDIIGANDRVGQHLVGAGLKFFF